MNDKEEVQKFIDTFSDDVKKKWQKVTLDIVGGRAKPSPVMPFYEAATQLCHDGPWDMTPTPAAPTGTHVVPKKTLTQEESGLFISKMHIVSSLTDQIYAEPDAAKRREKVQQLAQSKHWPKETQDEAYRLVERIHALPDSEREPYVRNQLSDLKRFEPLIEPFSAAARKVLSSINVRADYGPKDDDFKNVNDHLNRAKERSKDPDDKDAPSWCSLIYTYWLEEAGLLWAIERLADRVENGVIASTRPLVSVRVAETGALPAVLSKYAHIWKQGDLSAVDERRRQYLATYGFPLHAAARWGQLETVDPNLGFAAAFHGFLLSAMRFYHESRNTQMVPDVQDVMKTFDQLGKSLREHNENLRLVRPAEFRGQVEYVKQVLGGAKSQTDLSALVSDWEKALPGRPGIRKAMDPWEFAVDAVADFYQWRRPSVTEYLTLAENGELLLIIARIYTDLTPALDEREMWGLLDALRERIRQYVHAYKLVSGVDLSATHPLTATPFLGAPALAMAKHVQPPIVPPLRRNWATELPTP